MEGFFKVILPFISTAKTYDEALTKLASFAFYETYLITLLLRANMKFDSFLTTVESWGPVGNVIRIIPHYDSFNIAGAAIAFLVAILTHMLQFHDRISDVVGIRRRFDQKNILIPLSERVGSNLDDDKRRKIARNRDDLMHTVFYRYASSRSDKPLVDRHDIEHAVNAWCWFWVFVEGMVYFAVGAIIAICLGSGVTCH